MGETNIIVRLAGYATPEADGVCEDSAARVVGLHGGLPQPGRGQRRAHQVQGRPLLRRRLHRERPPRLSLVNQHQERQSNLVFALGIDPD